MRAVFKTDKGNVRTSNQDTVVFDKSIQLFGIADGMGGHNAGDVASSVTDNSLREMLQGKCADAQLLQKTITQINEKLFNMQSEDPNLNGMGTTLSVLWAGDNHIIMSHVGDSKVFLFHHNRLRQMSKDHSLVGEMVRKGSMTREEARRSPYRNMITRALGTSATVDIDTAMFDLTHGDRWMVCSDGLTEHVEDNEIEQHLATCSIEVAVEKLLSIALERGGHDNISIVILEVDQ